MSEIQYFSLKPVLSRGCPMNFIIGHRSAGKTYAFKEWAIVDFLKNKKEFVYVRRIEDEVQAVKKTLFDDIAFKYNKEVKCTGNFFYIRDTIKEGEEPGKWEKFGYIIPVSEQQSWKSSAFPLVNKICYDEFIIENTRKKYLPKEVDQFISLVLTIARDRNVKVILLSNSGFISNPFFSYYNIKSQDFNKREFVYRNERSVIFQLYKNNSNSKVLSKGLIGKISNENYINYAINNAFMDSSLENVRDNITIPVKNNILNIFIDDKRSFILSHFEEGVYITPGQNKLLARNYTLDSFSTRESVIYDPRIIKNLKSSLNRRTLFFSDPDTRAVILGSLR